MTTGAIVPHQKRQRLARSSSRNKWGSCRLICLCLVLGWIIIWIIVLNWTVVSLSKEKSWSKDRPKQPFPSLLQQSPPTLTTDTTTKRRGPQQDSSLHLQEVAREIPGIDLRIPFQGQSDIQVVYATTPPQQTKSKGLVLLLHACTHSAFKFMSPSLTTCPDCVGLAEELRIVRLVLEQGYTPVAVSSVNRKRACWSTADIPRIQQVLKHALFRDHDKVVAMGAS